MTEAQLKLQAVNQVLALHHKAEVVDRSGLDVERLLVLVNEVQALSKATGLKIEILATADAPRADYRTTTLRVMRGDLCVLSRTLR